MRDGTVRMVAAFLWVSEVPGGETSSHFGLFEAYCPDSDSPDGCLLSIDDSLFGKAKAGEVEIDPTLGSAHLKVKRHGRTHEITWTGEAALQPDAGETTCDEESGGASAWGRRAASASGVGLGKKLKADAALHIATLTFGAHFCDPTELFDALMTGADR
jgi:hypothetical protein